MWTTRRTSSRARRRGGRAPPRSAARCSDRRCSPRRLARLVRRLRASPCHRASPSPPATHKCKARIPTTVSLSTRRTLAYLPRALASCAPPPTPTPAATQTDPSFRAVWDHWLLDSICTFKRQSEINYAVRLDEEEVEYIVPGRLDAAPAPMPPSIADDGSGCKSKGGATGGEGGVARGRPRPSSLLASFFLVCSSVPSPPLACARCPWRPAGGGRLSSILGAVSKTQGQQGYPQQMRGQPGAVGELPRHAALDSPGISLSPAVGTLPLRKRPREAEEAPPPRAENPDRARLSVADYLKSKTAPPG